MGLFVKAISAPRFDPTPYRRAFSDTADEFGRQTKQGFDSTTATWKNKPLFLIEKKETAGKTIVTVATDNEIYGFVNDGTKPHVILPGILTGKSDKKALAFSSEFLPKTEVGIIGSKPGLVGPVDTVSAGVSHPGTRARKFNVGIKQEWEKGSKLRKLADFELSKANKEVWVG